MSTVFVDGSTTRICYVFEGYQPIIVDLSTKVTNNEGEYLAICYALEAALRLCWRDILVTSDSQLVIRQLTGRYAIKKKHLAKLMAKVLALVSRLDKVEFKWIRRDKNLAGIALEEK